MDYSRVPTSSCVSAQTLHTLIHEVGHWIGLFYPFDNSGYEGTEFLDDATHEELVNDYCPVGSNSCTNEEGFDSIHNYMSYTSLCCQYAFNQGQKNRSHYYLSINRPEGVISDENVTTFPKDREEETPTRIDVLRDKFVDMWFMW